ncbi:alpha/beta fold hydrolase [Marinomonas mediterranea]|uniref:Alpha/beta hydrolase fold protein n=1 Tax=Marinomonas mediterranea (strain ATCC 700492 / JCM 21426 / NBRC 103028 / MMB-1) TaxID=717774 RepID=F2JW56_MARM1|nr:alpha/beta hydrolase [Marinomonas mediterranea]ADZ89444.1 alpha/beta hydrolase fold protein [Marinomonas mediterranea MMB-1]WCN07540.1 alpha/beta fold hydrolase [Marinomonas mediterranea]WCN11638.1 alpha/beta fold hydrolase [Marinomonas mediterranea]WCN15697.1 alpha/beta fold hydrolase [Marinomonas mediterranea MMB-1]
MKAFAQRVSLMTLCTIAVTACSVPEDIRQNQEKTDQVLETPDLVKTAYVDAQNSFGPYRLHYMSNDLHKKFRNTVVFVHGTPGSWSSFSKYYLEKDLEQEFRLISVDRPGWGASGYAGDSFPISLQSQATLIKPMLKAIWSLNDEQKFTLVGHSLGGSLVPLLAAEYPEYVKNVIILAGDIDPELAAARWYNHVLDWVPSALIPDMWKHSNDEVLALSDSLENSQSKFKTLTQPVLVLQGTDDELVRPGNAPLAPKLFENASVEVKWLEGASHIINLTHVDDVKNAIRELAQKETDTQPNI